MNSTSYHKRLFLMFVGTIVLFPVLAVSSHAGMPVVDSQGFDVGYSAGDLVDHPDWETTGDSAGTATIQSTDFLSGPNGLRVTRGGNSNDYWAVRVSGLDNPNRYMLIDWDMRVTPTGSTTAIGPFFGVETYDETNGFNRHASLGVDATTGDVLYQGMNEGVFKKAGVSVSEDAWHHYQIRLDFQERSYQIFLDATPLLGVNNEEGFINNAVTGFTDADIVAIASAGDGPSQGLPGTAHFDNFLVREVSVADLNIDGFVDGFDLGILLENFNSPASPSGGELDGIPPVDGLDLGILLGEWCPPTPILEALQVPEPRSEILLLCSIAAASCVARRSS